VICFQDAAHIHSSRADCSDRKICAIGVKEIERLIQKLEIDKEILADQDGNEKDKDIFK
jgi:hypothetical protein